jgi:flagellar protein FlgJ
MTAPVHDAAVYSDLSGLAALKRGASASDPTALREVAKQFESIFAKMMLTTMRQASSSIGDPLFGSDQQQFYQGMFDDQLSLELTKGKGLGLADMLVRQLQHVAGAAGGTAAAAGTEVAKAEGAAGVPAGTKSGGLQMAARGTAPTLAYQSALSAAAKSASSTTPAANAAAGAASTTTLSSDFNPGASLDATNDFVQKLLAGNAAASGAAAQASTPFRTPASPEDFVKQLWPCAEEAGRELGINPNHLLAQAALETGWGKSLPCDANGNPSFNFFGIKAGGDWTGGAVSARTLEFQGGVPVPQNARFRSYDSAQDSFRDYVALLRDNPRYADALNTGNDAKAFATALQRGGYATDPAYAQKIAAIAQNLGNSATALKSPASQPIPSTPGTLHVGLR